MAKWNGKVQGVTGEEREVNSIKLCFALDISHTTPKNVNRNNASQIEWRPCISAYSGVVSNYHLHFARIVPQWPMKNGERESEQSNSIWRQNIVSIPISAKTGQAEANKHRQWIMEQNIKPIGNFFLFDKKQKYFAPKTKHWLSCEQMLMIKQNKQMP